MKMTLLFIVLITFSVNLYSQDLRYIRDRLYVTLRVDPSPEARVSQSGLVSGTILTLIELSEDQSYSLVRTVNGIEGWLQSQYLSLSPTASQQLESVNQELTEVSRERTLLADKLAKLELSHNSLEQLSMPTDQPFTELTQYGQASSDSLQFNKDSQALLFENQRLNNQLQVVTIENQSLRDKVDNNSFLNGAFAVLIGVFITLVVSRLWPSRRSEWK